MNLKGIREIAFSRFLATQRLYRLTQSKLFEIGYDKANNTQKLIITSLVEKGLLRDLKTLIHSIATNELEDKNIMELRKIARKYGIKGYNTIIRTHLIEEIEDAISRVKSSSSRDEEICSDVGNH